ncbi:hypothetical protein ACE1B6_25920 [Aerosakkonemataceae cyanobacterium BLCC-F154]|uniref:Ribbon-helix-helix protein CopG domain-containing protein n=1 Tax=Floridaenema fluviatile BLCC-F154 TaxID=3153640 RepID=A0ABV4YIN6_9CYAN
MTKQVTIDFDDEVLVFLDRLSGGNRSEYINKLLRKQLIESSEMAKNPNNITDPRAFIKLPVEERRRLLAKQSEAMLSHYQEDKEWQELQTWDLMDD